MHKLALYVHLVLDFSVLQHFYERRAASIQARNLVALEFDFKVVDPQSGTGRQTVFDGLDRGGAVADGSSAGPLADVLNFRGNANRGGSVEQTEYNSRMWLGGLEAQQRRLAGEQT